MATQADFLVNNTVTNCNTLIGQLLQVESLVTDIVQRMEAIGTGPLAIYPWPPGYTQQDFVDLYQALAGLPGLIVSDSVRDKIYELISFIQ